jgi:hypothetical protein
MSLLDLPCGDCGAAPGAPCVGRIGAARGIPRPPHTDRIFAAYNQPTERTLP